MSNLKSISRFIKRIHLALEEETKSAICKSQDNMARYYNQ